MYCVHSGVSSLRSLTHIALYSSRHLVCSTNYIAFTVSITIRIHVLVCSAWCYNIVHVVVGSCLATNVFIG